MATPPSIRQITREVLGGAVPAWADKLLTSLNQHMQQVADALTGNLTPGQNFAMQWLEVRVVGGQSSAPLALPKLKGKAPYGVSVEGVTADPGVVEGPVTVTWEAVTLEGKPAINLTGVYGVSSGMAATLTLLVKAQ